MVKILTELGFKVEAKGDEAYHVTVPSWRNDCTYMEDLSEEVARIYGFDKIASTTPFGRMVQGRQSDRQNFVDKIKHTLASLGMTEELSFSLRARIFSTSCSYRLIRRCARPSPS